MESTMEEKLIEAVRERKLLYDTSHADYMKFKLKLQIWSEVAKEIGMQSGVEAKKLWEKLRHSLRDALRRQKQCVKSGEAASTLKPWKYQTDMGFLLPYMSNRKREIDIKDESDEDSNTQNYDKSEFEDTQDSVELEDERLIAGTASFFPSKTEGRIPSNSSGNSKEIVLKKRFGKDDSYSSSETTPTQIKRTKKKKDTVAMLLKQDNERVVERAPEKAILDKVHPSRDPLYHFFMYMYETTKGMPPSSQHLVKNDIFKVVSNMEANLFNINRTQGPS